MGYFELSNNQVRAKPAITVEQFSFSRQMIENLFHKKRIALGLPANRSDYRRRRLLRAQRPQHRFDPIGVQLLQCHRMRVTLSEQRFERMCERRGSVQFE